MNISEKCAACGGVLQEPYVACAVCPTLRLCTACFARGTEVGEHQSCHSYSIVSDEVWVLEQGWKARDERKLLDLLMECGYGNWNDIGRRLGKPALVCKKHYDTFYLARPPKFADELKSCLPQPPFLPAPLPPHIVRLGCDNPPRLHSSVPGYNALRSEFDMDHDRNMAELDLSATADEVWETTEDANLFRELQIAMVEVFNDRMLERERRRRIIREHGLIMNLKNYSVLSRYSASLGRPLLESLARFAQLLTGPQFDYLLEGLHMSRELQERLNRLTDVRACGIKTFRSAKLMQRMSDLRTKHRRELKANNLPMLRGVSKVEVARGTQRKPAAPLEISGLPMYEKLTLEEKELCAYARLVPENFIEFKNLLVAECKKTNGIRLAQARRCIKIDVNKTRKLFDFLMEQGVLIPPIHD